MDDGDTDQRDKQMFKIVSREELGKMQLKLIEMVAAEMGVNKWNAALLLQHFKYVFSSSLRLILSYSIFKVLSTIFPSLIFSRLEMHRSSTTNFSLIGGM